MRSSNRLLFAGLGQIQLEIVDGKGARIRGLQQVQAAQQGRLAGAGGTDDDDNFPFLTSRSMPFST